MLLALVRLENESPCFVLLGSGSPPVERVICLEILRMPVHGKFMQNPQCRLHTKPSGRTFVLDRVRLSIYLRGVSARHILYIVVEQVSGWV